MIFDEFRCVSINTELHVITCFGEDCCQDISLNPVIIGLVEEILEVKIKGKGAVEYWAAVVKPGRIIFEVGGVPIEVAKEALRLAAQKLPVKTKFVIARDYEA